MPTRRRPRVERLFKTLQDRLVKDLRLAGIATVEAANQFVETWLPRYNRRFAVPPAQAAELHRPVLRACEGGRTDRWDGADDPPRPAAHLSGQLPRGPARWRGRRHACRLDIPSSPERIIHGMATEQFAANRPAAAQT
jgi:hypothetical protein